MTDPTYIDKLLRTRRYWKQRARTCAKNVDTLTTTLQEAIILPGRHEWPATAERWRGLIAFWLQRYGGALYLPEHTDIMVGITRYESTTPACPDGGDPYAVCRVEWVGEPPEGYDPDDPSTKASGLYQHIPAYWPDRSRAAGFEGADIFDANANTAVACYMVYAGWPEDKPIPHFHHWSGAHVGVVGSLEKVLRELAL